MEHDTSWREHAGSTDAMEAGLRRLQHRRRARVSDNRQIGARRDHTSASRSRIAAPDSTVTPGSHQLTNSNFVATTGSGATQPPRERELIMRPR